MSTEKAAEAALGADIGATFIKWVRLVGRDVTAVGVLPTPVDGPEAAVAVLAGIANQQSAARLGVAVPGHLTPDLLCTTMIPNIPGEWDRYPLAGALRKATGVPVALINDARAFAFAELALGAARWRPDALFLTLGTGVGGAIALDGAVLRNAGDRLGEIGHITVIPDGSACTCGSRGCLEAYAGSRALGAAWSRAGGSCVDSEDLTRAAQAGNPDAQRILDTAGRAIGTALGSVLAMLGFRTVVIGGGVAAAFELMRPAVMEVLGARMRLIGQVELLIAELGPQAGAVGAALHVAVDDLLTRPVEPKRSPGMRPCGNSV
jgi:glucokinase